MGPAGRLRSFLVGLYLISVTVADCPTPWVIPNTDFDDNSECPESSDAIFRAGCKLRLKCSNGFIPTSDKWSDLRGPRMLCGDDELWRDSTGTILDMREDDPNVLVCMQACNYSIDPVAYRLMITKSPDAIYNFTNPYDGNKLTSFIKAGDSFSIRCTGDRVLLHPNDPMSLEYYSATYKCSSSYSGNEFNHYESAVTNPKTIGTNCWIYCPAEFLRAHTQFKGEGVVNGNDRFKYGVGGYANYTCSDGYSFPPGSAGDGRVMLRIQCSNAEANTWTDMDTNQQIVPPPCIKKGQPGECIKLDTSNVTVLENTCEETATGVKEPCSVTVRCKQGMHPVDSAFLNQNNGSQKLLCQGGLWVNEQGSYASPMECTDGCIREIESVDTIGAWNQNQLPPWPGAQCWNITIYKQPPPYHPYYCEDLEPTATCNQSCRLQSPLPQGVQITNYTLDPQGYRTVLVKPRNFMFAGHSVVYSCKEGYMYPPDSSPARSGKNHQEIMCTIDRQLKDVYLNEVVPVVGCVPISGCPVLQPNDNVILSNQTNCAVDKNSYNNGCQLKYDCASGFYPAEEKYLIYDGQELNCNPAPNWYSPTIGASVNQTLTCIKGCVKMDWQQIIKQMNETTINIEMTTVKDTAGDDHYCFDTTTIQKVHDIWQNIMKGRNKYYCETQNRSETIDLTFSASFDCQKSCLVLDTSVLPSGLKLVTNPPTFTYTYNGKTYIGQNRSYVFQCEDGTNVFGEAPTYQQKLECDGVGYINPETGAPQTVADLKPCNKSPICPVKNTTTIIISADCQLVNNTVAVGCSVNTTCVPGFYPVDSVIVQNNQQSVTCNITKQNNATWITISTNETTEVSDCEPGTCPVPNNTDTVKVTSSCQILNGQVTTNCNVTEQCVEGLVPVDTTGVVDGKRDSRCDTVSGKNGTLIVIGVGQPLPPLNCTNKPQCIVRPNTTEVLVTTEICRSSPAALGCIMHEECVEGLYPINITDITQLKQTSICNVTTNGTATWIDISLGTPTSPREGCAAPCNTTTPPGTKLTHQCAGVQGGVTVGCSASLVCEDDLVPINIDGKALTNMTCDGKGHNSTWIDISTGQPARQDACGCPAPEFKNGTNINSTCYVAGVGGPPGCTVDATCAPGTAPIYGQTGVTTNTTIVCKNDTTTGKTTWIDISIGQPFAGKYCPRVCPPISIPNTRVEIQCPTTEGGYAVDCPARVICIDGYVGYNVKYNKASVVNVTCKAITSDNSTFIEISTNETLEDFCEKETCKPINETNLVIISNCTVIGGAAPVNCSANATCKEGTLPVYIDGKTTVDTSIYCGKTGNQNATWIVISTGEPFPPEPCAPVCKYTEVPYTTIRTECVLKDGGYQVGCRVQVECIEGYTGININYKYSSVVNISCDSTDMKNSTFIELTTGLPLEASLCGARATTLTPIDCDPIDTATENVTGDCYLAGVGAPRGCEANVTCIPGTYPVHVNGKEKSTTTVVCKEDPTTKKTTWIDISTDQEYKSEDCRPPCPLKEIPHTSIKTECVRQDGGLYSVGCQVQLKCDPGYTGINVNYNYSSLVNISCNATTSQNSTFIELTTGQPVEADICGDKCDPINSTNAVPNATCYQMVNGAPVGCEVNVTCIPGTYPVNVTSNEATTTSVVCNKTTTGKNTWVDVSTGLEVPAKDCRKPCENLTSIPHSRSNYSCQPINLDGQYRVGCTATLECDEGYIPVNIVTGANGVINMKCSVVTSENSTFVEISTGLPLRGNVCIPACPEILPGPGVILIDQTCSSNSTYALDCRKNFACGEGTSPTNPGSPTNNSAVCKVDNGKPTWIDPATNQAYKPLDCPTPTGCTPITKDPTTEVTNRTCTPSNPPPSIHPENCVVDVECLKGYYPTEQGLRVYDEHKAECLKNNQTGKYEWYDRTVSAWWRIYTCTKGCLNETLPTQSNTSSIEGTPPKQCTFTTQPFGTGKYMCDLTEITTATCDNTCPKLIVNPPLTTGSEPQFILTKVVATGGKYDVYCPNGWVWKGTSSSLKTYTCLENGTYISSNPNEESAIVVISDCEEPTESEPNCTLTLTEGQEIVSSTCDTGDEIYEGNCLVVIKCKNGTYPTTKEVTQSRVCDDGEWVIPGTKTPIQQYSCETGCKDISTVIKNSTGTPSVVGNTTVTCTILTIEREMIKYICGNVSGIDPANPVVQEICNNTCNLIGLGVNLTNTRTVPNLIHNKVPLYGQTEVQCPPGTVFKETGSRTNWYTCMVDETYNGPNGTTRLTLVPNTCVDPDSLITTTTLPPTTKTPDITCPELAPGPGVVQRRQNCSITSKYAVGCQKDFECADGSTPTGPGSDGSKGNSAVCQPSTGTTGIWVVPGTGQSYVPLNCPTSTGCTPIPIDETSTHITNKTCTPSNGAVPIHPENCMVDVECLFGYYPTEKGLRVYDEHKAECLKNNQTGKYDWYDRTVGAWWKIYTCNKGCLNETLPTQSNTTLIEGPPQRQCTFNTLPFGTGKFMCDLSDITNATCDNTCPKLIVNPPLKIVTQPEFILTKVVATGGKYDVYCPDGWVWKGTTSASKTYTCLENGTYISSNPDEESTIVVIDDCEDPVNPGRNCTLTLTEGQEIVSSSCDTDDETYADNCIVELKCKNGTYPTTTTATYEQECDDGGWVVPGTKTPVQPYPCNSSCLIVSLVPSKQENTTTTVGNVTVFCVITRIDRDLIDYVCNETFINPTNPIVDETCNNTCVRIGLGVNMTNTRTIPNLVRDKVPLYGQTEVQCPPGTVFKETGSRRNWYTCTIDGTYNGPNGTTGLNFVKNTCVDPDSLITTTAAPPPITTTSPTPPTTPSGCEDIKYDASTHITNKTCTPFSNGLHPEWCIVDVKCRNGTYPETVEDRNRSEHKAQCQLFSNGSFGWVDLTLDGVEWCPYKCINGCLPVAPGQGSRNTTITRVGPVTYVCEVVTVPHLTGGYYCNLTEDVISTSCNGTCPPLQVNKPTTIIKAPTYIYGKLVPYGGTYEVSCPDSWFYNDTGLSVKNYTCEDGTYTDGNKTKGITVADDECTCVDGNCTLEVPENMIVEEVNCPIDDDIYAIGCQVKLRCKPGYRFARLNRTEWIAHIYDRWQCTLREERYIWIDTDSKEEACNDTCIPDKDCIDKGEINQNCYSVKETRLGKDVECQYCKYDTALDPYICPNVTRPENGTLDVCCDTCEELGIAEGLNKRRYAILIFKNKVAIGDYYTVECPTGQIFKETRTRGKNYTCNPGHKYTGPGGENITFVENTCIDEPPKGCGELPIDSSTFIINGTCTPFNGFPSIYPTNCTQDVKCKNGTRPELEGNLKYSWHSVECWYNPGQNNYFWFDLTLNTRWTPYKCIDGCVNATEPLTNENTSVVVTKENNTLVCNITTVAYQTGPYFCNTDEDVVDDTADCNGTCLALIVEDPLAIGKGLEPLVYKELVIVKGTYHIICPEGKWYNETCNSTRVYICDKDGKYTSENKTRLDKAIDTCEDVDEETPNCTLTVGEGVEINHKYPNCPARTTSEYGISCAVQLRCKEGYYPAVKEWITQEQYCGNQGDNQSYWWLFEPPQKAPTFGCKKGCIGQAEMKDYTRKRQETTTYNGVTVVCDVEYIDTRLIDKLCNKTSVKPSGEVSRSCSNTCRQLEMGPGMTYVPPSPHFFFGYVIRWDSYNVQCPNGKVWPETLTERKLFTCNQDGKYNTSTQTGLTIALDTCIPCPPTEAPTTTEPTTMTTPIPTCPDRAAPAKGTIFYNYTCSSGKNFKDCQLSYKCEINWYPTRVEDRTLLNRTAVCNGKIWIDRTTGKEFVDFGCSQGCLNDSSSLPRVTRVEQQVQIGDTTVCCNKTYIDGITRLYYCNYTQELSINCTETCKPLIVPQPPMTVVFYPERRVPNLNLIFRGTKYTVSCPAGKVFSGTNESYRNYTCDYNGKYYTETKGDLTSAETDCVDSTNPSTCTLSAPVSPAQLTSPNCGGVKDGKYAVSCVVYLACPKGNYPSLVEDQAYPNRTVECKIQQDGSVAWENIRSGKIVTDPYGCKSGCLTTAPAVEPITISGMNCEVVSIPVGSIDYQCDASDYLADGVKKSNCTNGCKDLPLDTSYIETSGPTILYHHVTNGTNYTVFCPPGMYFSTTTTSSQTFTCVNGVYKDAGTVTINPNSPTTGLGTCINPPPSGLPSKADIPSGDKVQLLATMNPSKDQGAVTAVPNSSVAENNILLPPPANDQQGTEDDDSKYYGNVCVAPW